MVFQQLKHPLGTLFCRAYCLKMLKMARNQSLLRTNSPNRKPRTAWVKCISTERPVVKAKYKTQSEVRPVGCREQGWGQSFLGYRAHLCCSHPDGLLLHTTPGLGHGSANTLRSCFCHDYRCWKRLRHQPLACPSPSNCGLQVVQWQHHQS